MKISESQILSISVRQVRESSALLNELRVGEKITANIIRSEGNKAILEIRGTRLTADFTRGVPPGGSVELLLTEKTPDRVAFTMSGRSSPDEFVKTILSMTILSEGRTGELPLHDFMKFIGSGKMDLLTLNLFLSGIKKSEKEGKTPAEILNSLLSKGISYDTLTDLSFILAGRSGAFIMAFYYSLFREKKPAAGLSSDNMEGVEDLVNEICEALGEDEEGVKGILEFLMPAGSGDEGYGEFAVPDEEGFARFRYIIQDKAFFLNTSFTSLGEISAVIKEDKHGMFINIFSDNDDIILFMKERSDTLKRNLELMNVKKVVIMFNNSKKMIDKLDVWRTDFYIKRDFDVRI